MEKGKYWVLLGTNFLLANSDLDSLDEVSDLSEFSGTSSSIKLTENGSKEEQVDLIYFSGKSLIAQTRKMMRLEDRWTSETGGSGGSPKGQKKGILILKGKEK